MQCKCSRPSFLLAARCATFVALVAPLPAHAQQFVLVDQTYTATSDNTEDSHFTPKLESGIPADLRAPTNYAEGSIHVDLEIMEAPSSEMTLYNICLENSSDYACLPYVNYAGKGSYNAEPDFADFWQYDKVDWTKGVTKVSLILKDKGEQKVQGNASYYPYKAHVTLTVVAEGSTFDPSKGTTEPGAGGTTGTQGGRGGASAGQAGSSGSGGKASTPANRAGSGGASNSSATAGKLATGSAGAGGATGAASGAGASKPLQTPTATAAAGTAAATSNAAVSGVDSGVDDGRPSVSSQLENTSGCSVGVLAGSAHSSWPLLALGTLLLRRRKRR